MNLLCFGAGYSGTRACKFAHERGWTVSGTTRTQAGADDLTASGGTGIVFDGGAPRAELASAIARATHILVSVPPNPNAAEAAQADPVLSQCGELIARAAAQGGLKWIGYLSTIGVYGDHAGAWVDEATEPAPKSARSRARLAAETAWKDFASEHRVKQQTFRLAGIYGPGRSAIDRLRNGTASRIVKPDQVFNRIHVDDIVAAVWRGLNGHGSAGAFNVSDDEPAPPQDVVAFAAELIGMPAPPEIAFADAESSPMARSFYDENKRAANTRMKAELGVVLAYPTYREGLRALA